VTAHATDREEHRPGPRRASIALRLIRVCLSVLPRGRARLARGMSRIMRRPFVDTVEPRTLRLRLIIDPADPFQMEIWAGAYQPHVLSFLRRTVRPGDRVLCAGLHIGYIAAAARRLAGSSGIVLAAEPDPVARDRGEENLRVSGDATAAPVFVFSGGLSDRQGEMQLHRSAVLGHSSLAGHHQAVADVPVTLTSGDEWLRSLGIDRLDVMVLDVEGWEAHVLRGLTATVDASPSLCALVELSPWALECAGSDADAVIDFWRSRGFDVRWASKYGPSYSFGVWGPPVENGEALQATDILCVSGQRSEAGVLS
jgi:FkbM family methyltransferase